MESEVFKKRGEIQDKDKWAVNEIYSCDEEWEREYKELQEEAPKLKNFEGKLGDAKVLEEYFEVNEKISRKAEKIYVYAHLRSDEDTSNTTYQAMMNKIDAYMAEYATYTAYVVPEILALPDGTIEKLMNENKGLEPYKFLIENILKEHIGKYYEILETSEVVYIGTDFPDEFSHSIDTKNIKGANAKAKANAIFAIDKLIKIANNKREYPDFKNKHGNKAKHGWYRYDTHFGIPVYDKNGMLERYNVFGARILIRCDENGDLYLYDIVRIKKETSRPL